ncbi:MAG: hypothetical protein QXR60_01155 [Candidatus Nanoarchaeia archaeon]
MSFKKFFFPLVFVLFISSVSAYNVCCEKTTSGEYCLYTDQANCAADSRMASTTCEQTSYCKIGCCYNSDEGMCYMNTPKAKCELSSKGNTWDPSGNCDITQCKKGCCLIGNEAFFVTQVRCKAETSLFPNVTMTFDENVQTEQECIGKSRAQEEGCCVSGDTCTFTTRGACPTASVVQAGNETGDGFYSGMLCSNDKLKCDCAKQQKTGCVADRDEVYWFDSCGNRENIYSSDKVASYNNGYVLSKEQSCKLKGAYDSDCGNCDYSTGTLCGNAKNVKMDYGEFTCRDVNCKTTYKDSVSVNSGTPKKNGESWCIYDTLPGHARDAVGSRHFRHICVNGEEMVEPCRDFREELCVQGVMGNAPAGSAYESFGVTGNYIEAACRDNRWEDCFACNSQTSCGGECAGKGADCCIKKCCEDTAVRDCYFLKAGIAKGITGVCVPDVPPGLSFWTKSAESVSSSTKSSAKTSTTASSSKSTTSAVTGAAVSTASGTSTIKDTGSGGSSVCNQANVECTVKWHMGGVKRILGSDDWECVENCHCTEHSWVVAGNTLCKSLGDCGAYFNIVGKVTLDGYSNTASAEKKFFTGSPLKESEVGDWKTLSQPGKELKEEESSMFGSGKFSEFFKKSALPLAVMVGTGIYTGYSTGWAKGAFTGGMLGGLNTIGSAVGWLFTLGKGSPFAGWATTYGTSTFKEGLLPKDMLLSKSEVSKFGADFTQNPSAHGLQEITEGANKGMYKVVDNKALGEVPKGAEITGQTGSGAFMGALNTIMWIYTIYNLVDVFLAKDKTRTYSIGCGVWEAPDGGKDCEKCNEDQENKPCSEYRCKSLGKLCGLVNQGTSEEKCVNMHPNDVNSPVISPWPEVLPKGFTLTEITAESNKGYKINEKLKAFQQITLGFKTDEPAQCKFGSEHSVDYEQKTAYFGDQLYTYEHQITFTFPSDLTTPEALKLTNGGTFNIYIRCKDATGNKNNRDYFIRFTIEASPDLTAPVIERTSIQSGAYMPYNINDTEFSVFTNEPAECKWNLNDTDFSLMAGTFTCADSGFVLSSIYYGLYECRTRLPVNAEGTTDYFFRCKDKKGNFNTESYLFSLRSTKPLFIDSTSPSGTLYQSDVELRAVTSGGAEAGNARCGYSNTDVPYLSMIEFFETNGTIHKQPLQLDKGDYFYYVTCRDIAGNEAYSNISFRVDVDLDAPKIVYIYTEGSILHLEMNEPSNCQYSTNSTFAYGAGTQMTGTDSLIHELNIASSVYYISCIDVYKNEGKFTVYI